MSDISSSQVRARGPNEQTDRDRVLALLLKPAETAWLLEERYEAPTSSWILTIVREGPQARWMRQRYRYDSAVDVLFFLGERPVDDSELATVRRTGKAVRAA
jgi:hypothetical protein